MIAVYIVSGFISGASLMFLYDLMFIRRMEREERERFKKLSEWSRSQYAQARKELGLPPQEIS